MKATSNRNVCTLAWVLYMGSSTLPGFDVKMIMMIIIMVIVILIPSKRC